MTPRTTNTTFNAKLNWASVTRGLGVTVADCAAWDVATGASWEEDFFGGFAAAGAGVRDRDLEEERLAGVEEEAIFATMRRSNAKTQNVSTVRRLAWIPLVGIGRIGRKYTMYNIVAWYACISPENENYCRTVVEVRARAFVKTSSPPPTTNPPTLSHNQPYRPPNQTHQTLSPPIVPPASSAPRSTGIVLRNLPFGQHGRGRGEERG